MSYSQTLVTIALAPVVVLMIYIYKKDRVEKESMRLLIKLVLMGVLSTFLAVIMESVGGMLIPFAPKTVSYYAVDAFLVVGFSEEFSKYIFMKKATWRNPEFNCSFDAVVYAVFVSLGFAAFENIMYCFQFGMATAIVRAVTSIPGHAAFGVFMGIYYGFAKKAELAGDKRRSGHYRRKAVWMPMLVHGFYDFLAFQQNSTIATVIFFIFIIITYIDAFKKIRKLSNEDQYL